MDILSFAIGKKAGGGSPTPPTPPSLTNLTATENGTYNHSGFDGYDEVVVAVPAVEPDLVDITITQNGTYTHQEHDGYDEVSVNVPNSYGASDEGKVVSSGALVGQTSTTKTQNGTYDTTTNNEVVVNVPNSYTAADEGKVVSNGALTAQTAATKTENGTYDTTLNNSITVNVPTPTPDLEDITITENGTYESSSHDGYGEVTVNVSGGGSLPENYIVETKANSGNNMTHSVIYHYSTDTEPTIGFYHWDSEFVDLYADDLSSVNFNVDLSDSSITKLSKYFLQMDNNSRRVSSVSINLPSTLTEIPDYFCNSKDLTSITLPNTITKIGTYAFSGLTSLDLRNKTILLNQYALGYLQPLNDLKLDGATITIYPNNISNTQLTTLDLSNVVRFDCDYPYSFYGNDYRIIYDNSLLTSIVGDNIGYLHLISHGDNRYGYGSIGNNPLLSKLELSGNVCEIYSDSTTSYSCIRGSQNLTEVKLNFNHYFIKAPYTGGYGGVFGSNVTKIYLGNGKGTYQGNATRIGACAFENTNITDIYVGWSEGEVPNAPWGATNATIHYDYVPEGE